MLTLTDNASAIVIELEAQPQMPEGSSLRISAETSAEPELSVAAAPAEPGDVVVEQRGATLFLDPRSAELLDDKVLDAAVDEQGRVEFALSRQV